MATSKDDQVPVEPQLSGFQKVFGTHREGNDGIPEIVELILKSMLAKRRTKLLDPDDRYSLSQETLAPPSIETRNDKDDLRDLINFRTLLSRTAAREGKRYLFIRTTARFNEKSLNRLKDIASNPECAAGVRKLSYMVPLNFPEGSYGFDRLRQDLVNQQPSRSARSQRALADYRKKLHLLDLVMGVSRRQQRLMGQDLDLEVLSFAMKNFSNLQQIRLMKVEDGYAEAWDVLLDNAHAEGFRPRWTPSFERAVWVLSTAVTHLKVPVSRFSSRFMSPPHPLGLTADIRSRITDFVGNLTGLDQEFKDEADVAEQIMTEISSHFALVWGAAYNLQALHFGFGERVSIPLEDVFHNITMPKLKHVGIHNWDLESNEIIGFLKRHKQTLRSVRLRRITLRSGRWKEVLRFIRLNLGSRLKWISLNGVGYQNTPPVPPQLPNIGGLHFAHPTVLHNNDDTDSESEIELEDYESSNEGTIDIQEEPDIEDLDAGGNITEGSFESEEDQEESEDDHNDDHDHDSDATDFHGVNIGDEPVSPIHPPDLSNSSCDCGIGFAYTVLNDDGEIVSKERVRYWQLWCCKPCIWHDPGPGSDEL